MTYFLRTLSAVLLALALLAPASASAAYPVSEVGPNLIENTISAIKDTITSIASVSSAASQTALVVDKYVLEPLAFAVSGTLLKSITSGVVNFVGGNNAAGQPLFVQNLRGHLQNVGDTQALAFFNQINQNSNSPFAGAISSSLRSNYLQRTSTTGFFAANQCTLGQYSSNVNGFLSGDWSQGGIAEWFALTTQDNNNPYTAYNNSQNELTTLVSDATNAREQELSWGQGFLSWCGAPSAAPGSAGGSMGSSYCTNSDGSPGVIQTPGSVIKDELDKALGSSVDKLVNIGNVSPEINSILGNIGTVLNTTDFAIQVLGGGNSSGLSGVVQPGTGGVSPLRQYQSSPYYVGSSPSTVYQNTAVLPQAGPDMLNRVTQYEQSWNTIGNAANAASASLTTLTKYCTDQIAVAQNDQNANQPVDSFISANQAIISSAQSAAANVVGPVVAQAAQAKTIADAARAMVNKVQGELTAGTQNATAAYTQDLQTLQTMPPTPDDVSSALQGAQSFGQASASPAGSLAISGGTLLDQMNLVNSNATALQDSCTYGNGSSGQ